MSDARQPELVFSFLDSGFAHFLGQLVSIIVKTLRNTNLGASRCFKMKKTSLPVDVRRSKTPLLKLPIKASKTIQPQQRSLSIPLPCVPGSQLCPVIALRRHLRLNPGPLHAPLFSGFFSHVSQFIAHHVSPFLPVSFAGHSSDRLSSGPLLSP